MDPEPDKSAREGLQIIEQVFESLNAHFEHVLALGSRWWRQFCISRGSSTSGTPTVMTFFSPGSRTMASPRTQPFLSE